MFLAEHSCLRLPHPELPSLDLISSPTIISHSHFPSPLLLQSRLEGMSFFGFDTNLPRDRNAVPGAQRGFFENPDPFAEVARATALEDDDA